MKTLLKVVGVLVCLFALVFIGFMIKAANDPQSDERIQARMAIELCWKEQERKSLAVREKQFVAGTCEMMEKSFIERFGGTP